MKLFRIFKKLGFVLPLLICLTPVAAQEPGQEILINGFAFAGDFDKKQMRFPYVSRIENELKSKNTSISFQINQRFENVQGKNFKITTGRTFSTKNSDSPLNGLMVLTGETVLVENYGTYWKIFVNLRGDALLFDYKGKKIIKTYPLNLALFDALEGQQEPSEQQILDLIRKNIFTSQKEGLISQFIEKISNVEPGKKTDKIFQIGNINIKSEALDKFSPKISADLSVVNAIVADALASELAGQTSISLMPAKINHALGVMMLQLENTSEQIELKVGDGDYLFNVDINKLAKAKQQQTNSEVSYIYGVNGSIQVIEPMSKEVLLESIFRNGAVSISPINKITQDDFPAYYDVINGLFKKFGAALKTRDYKWVNMATGNAKVFEQMKRVSTLIDGKGN